MFARSFACVVAPRGGPRPHDNAGAGGPPSRPASLRRGGGGGGCAPGSTLSRAPSRALDGATRSESAALRSPAEATAPGSARSEEHTSELQSRLHLVCRLL